MFWVWILTRGSTSSSPPPLSLQNPADAARGRGQYLIAKRSEREKAFPGKWTVPGGKLVLNEYKHLPKKLGFPQWYNVIDWVLRKEAREEVGLEIGAPQYVCNLVFVRPDGYPVVTLSFLRPTRRVK